MKINITTDEGEVIDIIELDGWDWRKPVGGAIMVGRIKEALERGEDVENGTCDWCGCNGLDGLTAIGGVNLCQDCQEEGNKENDGNCDWCGRGGFTGSTLIAMDDERVCQDCADNSK